MNKVTFSNGLTVSRLCFGSMTFGGQTSEAAAIRMVERCLDAGIDFFDTANVYNNGVSESMLGKALKGRRQRVILASKVRGKMGDAPDQSGLSRVAIHRAVEESLQRLETDYLDIYYLHQPDCAAPLEETLAAMEELVKAGKVRYVASSNYSGWQVCRMLWIAEKNGYTPALISQHMHNLLARGVEQEYLPMCKQFGVARIVYNPLAGGLLTGKHLSAAPLRGSRFDKNQMYLDRYWHQDDFRAVDAVRAIAERSGRSMVSLALNWLLHHAETDCVVLGASRLEHLEQNLKAADEGPLATDTVESLDQVWKNLRGVTPQYNR